MSLEGLRVMVLGAEGQLGTELRQSFCGVGTLLALGRADLDVTDAQALGDTIRRHHPDVIVNAAAYTDVERAEAEPELARLVNAVAPATIAEVAKDIDATVVHYSTDYVFDGSGVRAWRETDAAAPLNVYGRTKFDGEQAIRASGCAHLILRVSWLYGYHGRNFLKTMLQLASSRKHLRVVDDQVGTPIDAALVAALTAEIVPLALGTPARLGTYHLTTRGETTWFNYATLAIDTARRAGLKIEAETIEPVATAAYPTAAPRPLNSRLATEKLVSAFGATLPPWRDGVVSMVQRLAST